MIYSVDVHCPNRTCHISYRLRGTRVDGRRARGLWFSCSLCGHPITFGNTDRIWSETTFPVADVLRLYDLKRAACETWVNRLRQFVAERMPEGERRFLEHASRASGSAGPGPDNA